LADSYAVKGFDRIDMNTGDVRHFDPLINNCRFTIVGAVFTSQSKTLDFPLVDRLPWSLETLILRLAIKNCPKYWF